MSLLELNKNSEIVVVYLRWVWIAHGWGINTGCLPLGLHHRHSIPKTPNKLHPPTPGSNDSLIFITLALRQSTKENLVLQHEDPRRKKGLENTNRAQPCSSSRAPVIEAANTYTLQTHDRGTSTSSGWNQVKVGKPNGWRVNASSHIV